MTRIEVAVAGGAYPVLIDNGLLERAGNHIAPLARGRRVAIVTDATIERHLATLVASLDRAGVASTVVRVPGGEASKSWTTLARVTDQLLDAGIARDDHVIALGGGVIGDLAGFASAILKRGCRLIQIPTTLLAQVDSSVGGKTGINTAAGKNLVGAFHQPSLVLIDPALLATLPPREVRAGYAEVVKYGLIDDASFFAWCETNGAGLLAGNPDRRVEAIAHSVAAKARIVAADEHETSGIRALLNLGHTFGHALEAEAGFDGSLLHGEAVAAGCALAFRYSARRGLCTAADADRVAAHFRAIGLPTGLADAAIVANGARLVEHMRHDKKRTGDTLPFLLARGIGRTFLDRSVDLGDVATFLDEERR